VQGNFRMSIGTRQRCAFGTDRAIAKRGTFGRARDDSYVTRQVKPTFLFDAVPRVPSRR
jgi:hypothetical protein